MAVALHSRVLFTKALYTCVRYLHLMLDIPISTHLGLGSRNSALSYVRYLHPTYYVHVRYLDIYT